MKFDPVAYRIANHLRFTRMMMELDDKYSKLEENRPNAPTENRGPQEGRAE